MKIKKRLLSIFICVAMLVAMVPMNVFASETDGVAKYYEVKASNKQGSTLVQDAGVNYHQVYAHDFCDVNDICSVAITDYEDGEFATSSYFNEFSISKTDAENADEVSIQEFGPLPADIYLSFEFKEGGKVNSTTHLSEVYSYLFSINGTTYVMSGNGRSFVASGTPKEIYMYNAEGTQGGVSIGLDNYNAITGANIISKITSMNDMIDLKQAKLEKIDFILYKNGVKVETLNLADMHEKKIHTPHVLTYVVDYKLNADGSVTVYEPYGIFISSTLYAYYSHQPDKAVNIGAMGYYIGDGASTIPADVMSSVNKLEVRSIFVGVSEHHYKLFIDTTNIAEIFEFYETSNINPDGVLDITKPGDATESDISQGGQIGVVPDDNEPSNDKGNETTGDKKDETPSNDKENETPTKDSEDETTIGDNTEDSTTEVKDVILTEDNKVVSKDDMSALITENATKNIVIKTPAGITLTFAKGTMKAVDGKDTYDFGVSISDDYSKQSNMGDVTKDNFVSLIDFEYSGNLPAEATIKIPVGADRAGQTLYYLLKTDTGYTLIQSTKVDDEGYITVKQDHCSTYVVATEDVSNSISSDDNTVDNSTSTDTDKDNSSAKPNEQNEPKETKDSGNWYIYVIIVLVIAAIAGLVVLVVYKKKKTETQNN